MTHRIPVHEQIRAVFDDMAREREDGKLGKIIQYGQDGASRESEDDKEDIEGFLSPLVIDAYAQYMHFNRRLPDGSMRDGDDWQKGIPFNRLMRSMWRHFKDCWLEHRLWPTKEGRVFAFLGLLFNLQAYLHQVLLTDQGALERALKDAEKRREKMWGMQKEKIGFVKEEKKDV